MATVWGNRTLSIPKKDGHQHGRGDTLSQRQEKPGAGQGWDRRRAADTSFRGHANASAGALLRPR